MKRRVLVGLAIVLTLVIGGGFARAEQKPMKCWWAGYTLEMWGKRALELGPACVPCFGACHLLPPAPPIVKGGTLASTAPTAG